MPSRASRSTPSPFRPLPASLLRRRPPRSPWSTTITLRGPRRTVPGVRCSPASDNRPVGQTSRIGIEDADQQGVQAPDSGCTWERWVSTHPKLPDRGGGDKDEGLLGRAPSGLSASRLAPLGAGDRADVVDGPLGHLEQSV